MKSARMSMSYNITASGPRAVVKRALEEMHDLGLKNFGAQDFLDAKERALKFIERSEATTISVSVHGRRDSTGSQASESMTLNGYCLSIDETKSVDGSGG